MARRRLPPRHPAHMVRRRGPLPPLVPTIASNASGVAAVGRDPVNKSVLPFGQPRGATGPASLLEIYPAPIAYFRADEGFSGTTWAEFTGSPGGRTLTGLSNFSQSTEGGVNVLSSTTLWQPGWSPSTPSMSTPTEHTIYMMIRLDPGNSVGSRGEFGSGAALSFLVRLNNGVVANEISGLRFGTNYGSTPSTSWAGNTWFLLRASTSTSVPRINLRFWDGTNDHERSGNFSNANFGLPLTDFMDGIVAGANTSRIAEIAILDEYVVGTDSRDDDAWDYFQGRYSSIAGT